MTVPRDHEPFLAAILDRPADDLPRLVYADYLEEAGDADRAEFIRVQCELAAGTADPIRRMALEAREKALLKQHQPQWQVPIRGFQTFRRGFVNTLWTTADFLLAAPAETISGSTVRTLRITNADQRIDGLAEYPGFAGIEHLDLTNNNLAGDYRLRAILGNPQLGKLRGLNLHNNRIWADDVYRLSHSPVAERLTHLDLSGNGIGTDGVSYLANEPSFEGLVELNLRSDGLPEYESLNEVSMRVLTRAAFRRLRSLDVSGHHIVGTGFLYLCGAAGPWELTRLQVAQNGIGIGDSEEGFISGLWNMKERCPLLNIDFSRNTLSQEEAEYLLEWPPLARMDEFRLTGCDMTDETRALLLASPHAAKFHLDDGDAK